MKRNNWSNLVGNNNVILAYRLDADGKWAPQGVGRVRLSSSVIICSSLGAGKDSNLSGSGCLIWLVDG